MTSNRLIVLVRTLLPNAQEDSVLLYWLSACENSIQTDILLISPEDCTEITVASDESLLVPHPFDKLYLPYLQAQISHASGEYDDYSAFITLYNAYRLEYATFVSQNVNPGLGRAVLERYYITAYAIAVEHGFNGTVEDWLLSLHGADGTDGIDGADGQDGADGASAYAQAVEGGYTGTLEEFEAAIAAAAIAVPQTRKINGQELSHDIILMADGLQAVSFGSGQSITDPQKAQARENIGAMPSTAIAYIDKSADFAAQSEYTNLRDYILSLPDGAWFAFDDAEENACEVRTVTAAGVKYQILHWFEDDSIYEQQMYINSVVALEATSAGAGVTAITHLCAPTTNSQAANKGYVDAAIAAAIADVGTALSAMDDVIGGDAP